MSAPPLQQPSARLATMRDVGTQTGEGDAAAADIESNASSQHLAEQPVPPATGQDDDAVDVGSEGAGHCCRLCLDDEEDHESGKLFAPCRCSGTAGWIHENCLRAWRTAGHGAGAFACCTCGYTYRLAGKPPLLARFFGVKAVTVFLAVAGAAVMGCLRRPVFALGKMAEPFSWTGLLFGDILVAARSVFEVEQLFAFLHTPPLSELPPIRLVGQAVLHLLAGAQITLLSFLSVCLPVLLMSFAVDFGKKVRQGWGIAYHTVDPSLEVTAFFHLYMKSYHLLIWATYTFPGSWAALLIRTSLLIVAGFWTIMLCDVFLKEAAGKLVPKLAYRSLPDVLPALPPDQQVGTKDKVA
ncbi:hypothetical protein JCM10213v2_007288 [Rhodosporidiobolus nylandii]